MGTRLNEMWGLNMTVRIAAALSLGALLCTSASAAETASVTGSGATASTQQAPEVVREDAFKAMHITPPTAANKGQVTPSTAANKGQVPRYPVIARRLGEQGKTRSNSRLASTDMSAISLSSDPAATSCSTMPQWKL